MGVRTSVEREEVPARTQVRAGRASGDVFCRPVRAAAGARLFVVRRPRDVTVSPGFHFLLRSQPVLPIGTILLATLLVEFVGTDRHVVAYLRAFRSTVTSVPDGWIPPQSTFSSNQRCDASFSSYSPSYLRRPHAVL